MGIWAKVGIALVLLIVLAGTVAGGIKLWTGFTEGLVAEGKAAGKNECDAAYKERDNKALRDALAKVTELTAAKEAAEAQAKKDTDELSLLLERKTNEAKKLAADNKRLTGDRRVRESAFTVQAGAGCPDSAGGSKTKVAGSAAAGNETATCDLSAGTKRSLRNIGLRADETALTLGVCQSLLMYDRKFCNGP